MDLRFFLKKPLSNVLFSYQQCWKGACGWINPAAKQVAKQTSSSLGTYMQGLFLGVTLTQREKNRVFRYFLCLKIHQRKSRKQMFKNNFKNSAINIFKTNNLKLPLASIQGYLQLLWPTGRRLSHLISDLWQPEEGKWIISMLWHNFFFYIDMPLK